MIEHLLPDYVSTAEYWGEDETATLFAAELAQLHGSVTGRVREFATARSCARRALSRFGVPLAPLLNGPDRAPLWPSGFVGSITHCDGYRGVAVARQRDAISLGIDAESKQELPPEVVPLVTVEAEREWLSHAPGGIPWGRLLFSAKERIYKAWFPLVRRWLGFADVCISVRPDSASFHGHLLIEPPRGVPDGFEGRFMVTAEHVLTAITISRSPPSSGTRAGCPRADPDVG